MQSVSQLLLTFVLNAGWQIALITAAAALCARLLRRTSARHKHLLWAAALALALCLPVLTIARLSDASLFLRQSWQPSTVTATISRAETPSQLLVSELRSMPSDAPTLPSAAGQETKPIIPINRNVAMGLAALYFLFLCYRSIKLFRAWLKVRAIVRSAHSIELSKPVQAIIARCQTSLGVAQVRVLCSPSVTVPITVGSLTPLIILPEPLLQEAEEAEADVLTSAIGHELAHILRRDYLLNLIYELISLPLSFHPAMALVRRRIQETRELRCDELVTERLLDAEVYARSLVQLASSALPLGRRATTITVGIIDADILEERVMTMLKRPQIHVRRKSLLLLGAALFLIVPCVAAAPFALRISINAHDTAATPQSEARPEAWQSERAQTELVMPTLEANTEAGTVVAWLKKPGDSIERGEVLARVDTGQGLKDVAAIRSGVVTRLVVQTGEKAPAGAVIATIREQGQPIGSSLFGEPLFGEASREGLIQGIEYRIPTASGHPTGWQTRGVAVSSEQDTDQAEHELREARTTLENARANLERQRQLYERGLVSQKEIESAQQALAAAEKHAQAVMEAQGKSEVQVRTENGVTTHVFLTQEPQTPEERQARQILEQAERTRRSQQQAELVKQARITMDQAIQMATNQYPGTVLESRLAREQGQACYILSILSDNGTETTTTRVMMSAVDGHIINSMKGER